MFNRISFFSHLIRHQMSFVTSALKPGDEDDSMIEAHSLQIASCVDFFKCVNYSLVLGVQRKKSVTLASIQQDP